MHQEVRRSLFLDSLVFCNSKILTTNVRKFFLFTVSIKLRKVIKFYIKYSADFIFNFQLIFESSL